MTRTLRMVVACSTAALLVGFFLGSSYREAVVSAQAQNRVFELRTYTAPEGRLVDLQTRFRDHTSQLFERHGMTNIGYWVPRDAPDSQNTLIYILAHSSREAAQESWAAFGKDPDWQRVRTESQVNGRITTRVQSVFMEPTDFSPMK